MRLLPALALCAVLPLPALAQTAEEEGDRGFLVGLIEDALSSTARTVRVEGFEGALSSRATVASITIADREGVWLRATDLALDWNRSALLRGRIDVTELTAASIEILRPPLADPQAPTPEATPFSLPDLPVSVEIDALRSDRILLGAPFLGEDLALTLAGSVNLAGGEGAADIDATIIEGSAGQLSLAASYANETRVLAIDLDLQEEAEGLVARALGLPGLPSVALTVEGTAPIDDYAARIALSTDGEPRLSGDVALKTTATEGGEVTARAFGLDVRGDVTPLLAPEAGAFFGPDVQLRAKGIRREDGSFVLTTLGIGAEALDLSGRAEITPQGWPARIDLQGTIGAADGSPVPLPGAGDATVTGITLDVAYDQEQGDAWTGLFVLSNLVRPGLSLPSLTLDGGGTLIPATATTPGQITALFDYAARGLSLDAEGATEALGADITGRLDLARGADGGPVELRALTLAAPGLDARIEGTIATAEGLVARTTTVLDAADLGRFAALTGADLGGSAALTIDSAVRPLDGIFEATATGTTQDLRLGIAQLDPLLAGAGDLAVTAARDESGLRVQRLDIATPALTITGTADVTSGASTARFDLAVTDLGLSFPGLTGPAQARATLDRAANGAATLAATATLPGASLSVDATQAAQTLDAEGDSLPGLVTLDARARADDLATYRPLLDAFAPGLTVTPSGGATLALTGTTQQDATTFDLTLDAQTTDLALGIAPLDALLAGEGTLAGRVQRSGPQSFSVDGLRVATDLLQGTVTAALTEGVGQADLDLSLSDVAPVLGGLSGPGQVQGTAARAADGSLDLDLSATLPTGTARIDGTLAPPAEGYAFTGDVNADFSDIAPLGPLVGRTLGGAARLDLSGTARPDLSVLDLTFDAATRDLRLGLPQIEPLLAGPGTASGSVQRSPETGLDLSLDAATPQLRALASGTFTDASGNGRFDVTVTDAGTLAPGLSGPARATGTATQGPDGTIAVNAQATAPGASALIDATLAPDRDNEITGRVQASVTDLRPWSRLAGRPLAGGLDATVTGSLLPSLARFDLTVDATARNLDPGLPALAPVLAGTGTVAGRALRDANGAIRVERLAIAFPNLTATARGTTGGAGTDVTFDARLADLALFVPQFPGPVTARGTARLGPDGTTNLDAQVGGPGGLTARVSGPLGGTATTLRATGTAPLELANAVLDPRRLEGPASFDLRLAGGLGLENLSGQVTVQGARLSDPDLAQSITGISGRLDLANGTATASITGDLAAGGRLSVTGPVSLTPPLDANLSITGTGLVIRDPALYEARGDARLTVTGPLTGGALIAGTVALSTVELRVPASSVGALGEPLPVFHIEPSVPVRETLDRARLSVTGGDAAADADTGGAGYGLDILLDAPARVFVRGRGLDAELGGQLRLTGTTAQVIPIGQFSLLRGRLDILGQRFTLSEGAATIQGDFNPFLRVVAQTRARSGTDISIILEGPLASPTVTFTSSPELPQDEVLAQLLFGVDIASITPLQAVQLAAAAANLAGGGGGLSDSLRSGVGLADFDVTTTESGNVALRLGQYVSENIYTDVLVATDETEATINLDLTPDLTVRAGVSSEGGTSVGIFFERDY
ncbi:translocation/assembly module TamB domain-containing protein [Rubellimicrobium aerolatum]|uniref:Translocation/assembly module TamB domain-containing protein n=1 Tax=Rubellimicrobium aerolatum TaxID=490979 RepID=A0ABW0SAT1_9RHOB|nr:translocation/assembly module TamB domain-containing protein [Rubellimicrobium aerolatum]MBP1806136.1 translocation and assembly module TamB [Rubellimicrobium aerolatum]